MRFIDADAIKYIDLNRDVKNDLKVFVAFKEDVDALPTIETVQGWIPIEKSEPNTTDHVLVTYKWGDNDYEVSELDYWVTKYASERGNEQCIRLINHVVAWQPLPTPYKGSDAE